jgi:ribosomal protein S18
MSDLKTPDVNTVLIAGTLINDPVLHQSAGGTTSVTLAIASVRKYRDNSGIWRENTCSVSVITWRRLAEFCLQSLKKKSAVIVEGDLVSRPCWKRMPSTATPCKFAVSGFNFSIAKPGCLSQIQQPPSHRRPAPQSLLLPSIKRSSRSRVLIKNRLGQPNSILVIKISNSDKGANMLKKKRICRFCEEKVEYIDFKNEKALTRFTTEQGKIIPRRTSGTCAKHQRQLTRAIKIARELALIPYISELTK